METIQTAPCIWSTERDTVGRRRSRSGARGAQKESILQARQTRYVEYDAQ